MILINMRYPTKKKNDQWEDFEGTEGEEAKQEPNEFFNSLNTKQQIIKNSWIRVAQCTKLTSKIWSILF